MQKNFNCTHNLLRPPPSHPQASCQVRALVLRKEHMWNWVNWGGQLHDFDSMPCFNSSCWKVRLKTAKMLIFPSCSHTFFLFLLQEVWTFPLSAPSLHWQGPVGIKGWAPEDKTFHWHLPRGLFRECRLSWESDVQGCLRERWVFSFRIDGVFCAVHLEVFWLNFIFNLRGCLKGIKWN